MIRKLCNHRGFPTRKYSGNKPMSSEEIHWQADQIPEIDEKTLKWKI